MCPTKPTSPSLSFQLLFTQKVSFCFAFPPYKMRGSFALGQFKFWSRSEDTTKALRTGGAVDGMGDGCVEEENCQLYKLLYDNIL